MDKLNRNTGTGRLRSDIPNLSNSPRTSDVQWEDDTPRFPHCDPRILHAPGKCQVCDLHPEMQEERVSNKISFTGEPPQRGMYPCPAEQARSSDSLNSWPGNRPYNETTNSDDSRE